MNKFKNFFYLHILLCFLSLGSIFSKFASTYDSINFSFLFFYSLQLVVLFIYAIFWQQSIKKLPLSTAYMNRAVTVFWGMLWGFLFFGEDITAHKILGCIFIAIGIILFIKGNEHED